MIKVQLKESVNENIKPFPKLMMAKENSLPDNGIIVFFSEERKGVVVYTPNEYKKLGYTSDSFIMEYFTDYNEPITIQNA